MRISCKRTWLLAALASLAATPVWADGELDASFGSNGIVRVAFPGSSRGYLRDVAVVNGLLEAAGYERESEVGGSFLQGCSTPFPDIFIVKLSLSGAVIGSPSSHAQQTIKCPSSLLVDSATGDIYVTGYVSSSGQEAVVAQFDSSGSLVASYTSGDGGICEATRILLDNQSRLVSPCRFNAGFGPEPITAMRLSTLGGQLTGGFLARSRLPSVYRMSLTAVTQDASSGAYYVGAAGECIFASGCPVSTPHAPAQFVIRLNADSGALDTNYGSGGVAAVFSLPRGELNAITLDGLGNVLIGGDAGGMDVGLVSAGYVARFDPSGTPDPSFGTQGVVQYTGDSIVDVLTDERSRVYALGCTSELLRFKVNGALDVAFSSSNVQTLNGVGSSWRSLQFVDSTRASAYLLGGAAGCAGCANAATTAVIAKVNLNSGTSGPGSTLTMLSSTATAIMSGQSVTFTTAVSGTNPTGTVTFKDGAITLGSPVALVASRASYSTSALAVGSHSISAAYSGDSQNMASTSQVVVETVTAATVSNGSSPSGGGGGSIGLVEILGALLIVMRRGAWRLRGLSCRHCAVSLRKGPPEHPAGSVHRVRILVPFASACLLAGCGGSAQSVPQPKSDFALSSSPESAFAVAGNTTYPITLSVLPLYGFSGPVSVTTQGLPQGVSVVPSASFSLSAGTRLLLRFSVTSSAGVGAFPVTITASSGALSHSVGVTLTVAQQRTYQTGSVLYLESGTPTDLARIGVETAWGGSITEVSLNGVEFDNRHDTGREVQVSYRDGNDLRWNPTLGGDTFNQGTPTISYEVDAASLHTRAQPLQWSPQFFGGGGGSPIAGDVMVEQTITAVADEPHTFKVHYKATHLGSDTHANAGQEFPAVYTNQNFNRFVYYGGTAPWTNDALSQTLFPNLPTFSPMLYVPERWGALVDSQNNGLTVYVPAVAPYMLGFASPDPGPGGPTDNATNYFSAQPMLTLTPGFVFEGDLFIIAGSYVTAREIIYRLHSELAVADIFAPAGATDAPAPGSTLTGLTTVAGWSFDDVSVAKVEVLVDGVVNGTASYGLPRPDVSGDWPHAPVDCGFSYPLDSLGLTNGTHTINVRVTDSSGNIALLSDIKIAVAN